MATAACLTEAIKNIIEAFERSLELVTPQLTEEIPQRNTSNFDFNSFWTNFIGATKLVSHEATKLCMAFQEAGMSSCEECQSLVDRIEKTCLALLSVFMSLPKDKGKTLHKEVTFYVTGIIQGMKNLCIAIKNQRNTQLITVGDLWEQCLNVERLSRDNREAVIAVFREQHNMVVDASEELMESIENEDESFSFDIPLPTPDNGDRIPPVQPWSPSDRNVLLPCSGLVKACKACLKKTMEAMTDRADASREGNTNELDWIADIARDSSSLVDNFVLSLYPPMDHSVAREQASLVRNNSKKLLSAVRNSHFYAHVDEAWVEFLEKALDHNWVRINDMVLAD